MTDPTPQTPAPAQAEVLDELARLGYEYHSFRLSIATHGPDIHMRRFEDEARSAFQAALAAAQPAPAPADTHPDDLMVGALAAAMKAKLAKARAKGRGGWQDPEQCSVEYLWDLLDEHARKGNADMVDVANLAGMLHARTQASPDEHENLRLHIMAMQPSPTPATYEPAQPQPAAVAPAPRVKLPLPTGPEVLYAERADYRDGDVTLVGAVRDEGVRLGMQAVEPWYGTGVLIPPGHPAYRPALSLVAALAQAQAEGGSR